MRGKIKSFFFDAPGFAVRLKQMTRKRNLMAYFLEEEKQQRTKKYFSPPYYNHVTISDTTGINTHSTCEVFIDRYIKKNGSGKYRSSTGT